MRGSIYICIMYLVGGILASPLVDIKKLETRKQDNGKNGEVVSRYQIRLGQENNHVVNEKLIINSRAQTEMFILPKYGPNSAAVIIDDFHKNLTLIKDKEKNICYFTRDNVMEETPVVLKAIMDREIHLQKVLKAHNQVENRETSSWQIGDQLQDDDKSIFDKDMMKMCGKRPVFWLIKIKENKGQLSRDDVGKRTCHSRICTSYYCTVYIFEPYFHTVRIKRTRCITIC